ncbi:MAG: two-component sensor histidine kinase [Firmicutes bacterium HGW-Firmicutes-21]|nr:MAG: two-component sensor histidine kinase [Firmicutes bacterium HGW-Firmicutes-21]
MSKHKLCRKMKSQKRISKIWLGFVMLIFIAMFISAIIIMPALLYFFKHELISLNMRKPALVVVFLFASIFISTAITILLAKRILRPIVDISTATKVIAKGNFDIRINEKHRLNELSRLAADFNKMVQELGGIETLRSDFIINISHEFKTPIAAIEGFALLLQDKNISEEERSEYLSLITESTSQLSNLLNNTLSLSKLESQGIISEKSKFRLDEQIRRIILSLEPIWSKKELNLIINMDTAYYFGNESMLEQVWLNILGNAMKFTGRGGSITIDLFEIGESITVKISDTGIGIDEAEKEFIFNKFYRTNAAKEYCGNGLGLALVKRILDLSGASIVVKSENSKGAEFVINLTTI